jgi:autotransporter-associated beta strand protein
MRMPMNRRAKMICAASVLAALGLHGTTEAVLTFSILGGWDTQARKDAATAAMANVVGRYNAYGNFTLNNDGNIEVFYNAGVPTAQSNYNGNITFGGTYPNDRVAQHESNHWLGSGTTGNWSNLFSNGVWTGAKMNALAAQLDGDGAVILQSGVHFYPYGLNYDTEVVNSDVLMRNIALTYAQRQDDGLGVQADPWSATNVHLKQSDPVGTSAFNWYGAWDDNYYAHPNAAYFTGDYFIRTPLNTYNPGGTTPSFTFRGTSLMVNNTNGINGGLLFKGVGTSSVLTINALILNGGYVRHASGTGDLFQLAGNIALSGGSTIDAAQGNIKILSKIAGGGSLTFQGTYATTLTGSNNFSGGVRIAGGTLKAGNSAALGSGSVTLNGGTLSSDGSSGTEPTIANAITVAGSSNIAAGAGTLFRVNSNIGGSAALGLSGIFNGAGLRLAGDNSGYTGTVTVTGSNTRLGATTASSAAAAWVINGNLQTDVVGGGSFGFGALSGSGGISGHALNPSLAISTLHVGALNTSTTFSGRITDNAAGDASTGNSDGASNNVLALTKVGAGVLTLSGFNTYTGPTTISAGTLRLSTPVAVTTPIASYTFNHLFGSTVINNGSGGASMDGVLNANGGTGSIDINGGPVAGMGALILNGNGTTVDINSGVTSLSSSANWTVSAWIKTTQAGATILNKGDGTNWTSGFSTFYLGDGSDSGSGGVPDAVRWGGGWLAGSSTVNDGHWHLLTYSNAAGTKMVYVDGVAETVSQNQFINTDTGSKIRIGFSPAGESDGNVVPSGALSGVSFYNSTLSAAQIAAMYGSIVSGGASPLPAATDVIIAAGATLDINGLTQTIGSLAGPAGSIVALGSGKLIVASSSNTQFDGAISGAGGSLVKSGAGSLVLGGNNSYTGVTTVQAGTLVLKGSGAQTPVLSGGGADIKAGKMVLDYAGGSDPIANVKTILGTGYASNFTSGQIRSSNSPDAHKGIGYSDDTGSSQLSLMYTYYGDANLDGQVNSADFSVLAANFNASSDVLWQQGDFNYDGRINALDFNALASNFGATPIASLSLGTLVPEPGSIGLLVAAAAVWGRRRRA